MARSRLLPPRAGRAIFAGTAVGASGICLGLIGLATTLGSGGIGLVFFVPYAFFLASIVFLLGLTFIGLPAWIVFDRMGWTRPIHGMLLGAFGVYAACAGLWMLMTIGQVGWSTDALRNTSPMAIDGALVGYTIWRIAYRNAETPAQETAQVFA